MNYPIPMIFTSDVSHRTVKEDEDLSVRYEDTELCGTAQASVDVYSTGFPGPFGSEYQFYYKDWQNHPTEPFSEYLLALSLSATNGWGHANSSCFKPA